MASCNFYGTTSTGQLLSRAAKDWIILVASQMLCVTLLSLSISVPAIMKSIPPPSCLQVYIKAELQHTLTRAQTYTSVRTHTHQLTHTHTHSESLLIRTHFLLGVRLKGVETHDDSSEVMLDFPISAGLSM